MSHPHNLCPYDLLDVTCVYARRLMLLADRSYRTEDLKNLNYAERKGALFAFFGVSTQPHIFLWIREAPGGRELMRCVVSFL